MRGNMHMLHVALGDELGVDFFLFGHSQIIGNWHDDHAGLECFILFIGDEGFILRFIGMGNNHFVCRDQRKPAGLEVPFLGQ
ncbi:hypothetical protein D3C75_910650 [compost metagenome]